MIRVIALAGLALIGIGAGACSGNHSVDAKDYKTTILGGWERGNGDTIYFFADGTYAKTQAGKKVEIDARYEWIDGTHLVMQYELVSVSVDGAHLALDYLKPGPRATERSPEGWISDHLEVYQPAKVQPATAK